MDNNMQNKNLPGHPDGCRCYGCYCGSYGNWHMGRHYWLRWVLGLIILAAVFCIGIKVGEFRGYYRGSYGNPPMIWRGGMMNGNWQYYNPGIYNLQQQSAPQTATTSPSKAK